MHTFGFFPRLFSLVERDDPAFETRLSIDEFLAKWDNIHRCIRQMCFDMFRKVRSKMREYYSTLIGDRYSDLFASPNDANFTVFFP
jgi:hypothetical protein